MRQMPSSPNSASEGPADPVAEQQHWRDTRAWLNEHRWELAQRAVRLYPTAARVADTSLLTHRAWMPEVAIPIEHVKLTWTEEKIDWPVRPDQADAVGATTVDQQGRPFPLYSDAMRALSPPKIFENRTCYGLRMLNAADTTMGFGSVDYFANIDIGEAVAHEYAALARSSADVTLADLPLRRAVGNPVDLSRRPLPVAISTLVLRVDRAAGNVQMLLHWRDPSKVASGGGLYQVAPVGVFQPSDDARWNLRNDFDLWRSIQREMSEELLGTSEDYASSAQPIDYAHWDFARTLDRARERAELSVTWLGAGIDPLTLVCDLLCCVTVDAQVFDSVFAALVSGNDEGLLINGQDSTGATVGVALNEESVVRYSSAEPMQPAGAALLRLAWRHRSSLVGR